MGTAEEEKQLLDVYHGDREDATPAEATRHCTDIFCVLLYVGAVVGMILVLFYSPGHSGQLMCPSGRTPSDMAHLTTMANFEGDLCGQDGRGPYLYFCNVSGAGLDLAHQICVDSCPTKSSTQRSCNGYTADDYESHAFAGSVCVPNDPRVMRDVMAKLTDGPHGEILVKVLEALKSYKLLLPIAAVDVVLAYVFLRLAQVLVKAIVYVCLGLFIVVPAAAGAFLYYGTTTGALTLGDANYDLGAIAGCFGVSFLVLCITCCMHSKINNASEMIEEACDCLASLKTLMIEPFINLLGKIVVAIPFFILGSMLLSCGRVQASVDLSSGAHLYDFDNKDKAAIVGVLFMLIWSMETVQALSQFAVSYAVEQWFFEVQVEKVGFCCTSWCSVLKGYMVGSFYHLGTFFFGAFLVTTLRVIRMIIEFMIQTEANGNKVVRCLGRCTECIIGCFEKFIEHLNKNAYMDTAMNGNGFCTAAKHALQVMTRGGNVGGHAILVLMTSFIQIVTIGGIACASAGVAWIACGTVPEFSDTTSPQYVQDPIALAVAAGIIGAVVALPFIHLLDIVALTINFCVCYRKFREEKAALDAKDHGGFCFFCPSMLNHRSSPKSLKK